MLKLSGKRPDNLGVSGGRLAPCPHKPNCVSSQAKPGSPHCVKPLRFQGDARTALERLEQIIRALPRTTLVERRDDYLYAEFSSALLGFVDDVEFYVVPQEGVIHLRSASRMGYSDFGVNLARVEDLRRKFESQAP
jgi:uncharacterized protein (DUF1499 family)